MIRTFIAVEIPDRLREAIAVAQETLKKHNERVGWTKPSNIHLTLKFLGDVEEAQIAAIGRALQDVVANERPFKLLAQNLGAFPSVKRPRVLWVGLEDVAGRLGETVAKLEAELSQLGFAKERRKFSPHLTIGRVKSRLSVQFLDHFREMPFEADEFTVREIILMKSALKPTGAVYTPLHTVELLD